MQNVTEVSIDEALQDVAHRRKMARLLNDRAAVVVLSRQLDRLLLMKFAQMEQPRPPMIHR